jgi:hypothetical protein
MVFLWFSYGTIEEGKPIVYQRVSYSLPEGKLLINQLRQVEGNTQKLPDDLTNGRSQDRLLCVPRWHAVPLVSGHKKWPYVVKIAVLRGFDIPNYGGITVLP